MATINGKEVKVSYEGVNGIKVDIPAEYMPQLREAIAKYQEGVRAILDLQCYAPSELWDEAYKASHGTICSIVDDRKHTWRGFRNGMSVEEETDFTEVPFLRVYDEDFCITDFKVV